MYKNDISWKVYPRHVEPWCRQWNIRKICCKESLAARWKWQGSGGECWGWRFHE